MTIEQALAMRGVKLCDSCMRYHFTPYPDQPGNPCLKISCDCWCNGRDLKERESRAR